jgi:hypothetical protein
MRIKTSAYEKKDGLARWDEFPGKDPRAVCFTCDEFYLETARCNHPTKVFTWGDRKVFNYMVFRCAEHKFNSDFRAHIGSCHRPETDEELRAKIHDLEMELSMLREHEAARKQFGAFLKAPLSVDGVEKEVDLSVKCTGRFAQDIFIDNIDPSSIKVNATTIWVTGYKPPRAPFINPVHYSLTGAKPERFIFKLVKISGATIFRDGRSVYVSRDLLVEILQDLRKLEAWLDMKDDSTRIMEAVVASLQGAHSGTWPIRVNKVPKDPSRLQIGKDSYTMVFTIEMDFIIGKPGTLDVCIEGSPSRPSQYVTRLEGGKGMTAFEYRELFAHVRKRIDVIKLDGLVINLAEDPDLKDLR